jgi:ribosomal protein S18 acetylase RimI-like enzyme
MTQDVLHRVHANFGAAVQTLAHYCGGMISIEDGLLCYASASPSPVPWNGALRTSGDMGAEEIMERAQAFFEPLGHGFSLGALEGIDDDLIAALGNSNATSPEMVIEAAPDPVELADGVEIHLVDDSALRSDWLEAVGEAFETLGESKQTWVRCYPDVESLANPESVAMVLYESGAPAAGGMYYRSGAVVEVLHIGTANDYRRKGFGRAVTTALTNHGFSNGATLASLQAEPMGFNTYQRIGYETISTYHWYIRPA